MKPYFALQPGANSSGGEDMPRGNRLISVDQLKLKGVVGLTVRHRRTWPLSFIDASRDRAKQAGDAWTLLVMGGDRVDPTSEESLRGWEATIETLAKRYANDESLWGVHVTGCTPYAGASEELHWDRPIKPDVEAAIKRLMAKWAAAFPKQTILLAISLKDPVCMERLIAYGLKVAPGRFLVKHNAMKATSSIGAAQNKLVISAGKQGAMIGFEMVGSTKEDRFGGTLAQMLAKVSAVEKAAGKSVSYLAVYPPDLGKLGSN